MSNLVNQKTNMQKANLFMNSLNLKQTFRFGLAAILIVATLGCAKVRETNIPGDGNNDRLKKSILTGLDAQKSSDLKSFEDTYFEGKLNYNNGSVWINKVTVVNTSSNDGFVFTGYQGPVKTGYFVFSRNSLQFRSAVNVRIGNDPGKYDDLVYQWPVEHSAYRYNEIDGRTTNTLVENLFENWKNKDYFTVDWAKQDIAQDAFFPFSMPNKRCWEEESSEVLDETRQITKDYIEYVVRKVFSVNPSLGGCAGLRQYARENFTYQVDYLFSYKRLQPSEPGQEYEPIVYNTEADPLYQKYGYFNTMFEDAGTDALSRKVLEFVNRWNPKKPVHTYYLAPGFPEKFRWIFVTDPNKKDPEGNPILGIFDQTNKVLEETFKRMKTEQFPKLLAKHPSLTEAEVLEMYPQFKQPMRFEVKDTPEGIHYGDIRYSFIKIVTEMEPNSPLGYGPSDANPFTGEIMAANSMLWVGLLDYYVRRIETEIGRSGVEGSDLQIYTEMSDVLGQQKETWEETLKDWTSTSQLIQPETPIGQKFKRMLPNLIYAPPFWSRYTAEISYDSDGNELLPIGYTPLLSTKSVDFLKANFSRVIDSQLFDNINRAHLQMDEYVKSILKLSRNDLNIYRAEGTFESVPKMLEDLTADQVIDAIMYRVAIHEFGHNLGLRHNFFGSVDKSNFDTPIKIKLPSGEVKEHAQVSSSVMDYHSLDAEMHSKYQWEAYDKAALAFAYSGGAIDHANDVYPKGHALEGQKKHFLYCTDEHRPLNAMCKAYDVGSTPSEIVMSMIDQFQKGYWTRNRRFGRPYWDTQSYEGRVFGALWDIKQFMLFDQTSFTQYNQRMKEIYKSVGASSREEALINSFVKADLSRAVKLSIAFYNAVLQQNGAERNYYSLYDEPTGNLIRKGTFADKFYSTYFLMGDDPFFYNPNLPTTVATYLPYSQNADVQNTLKEVTLNLLTKRVQADPWFITYNRMLYTMNVMNTENRDNDELKRRLKLTCYRVERFKEKFGLDPFAYQYENNTTKVNLVADVLDYQTEFLPKAQNPKLDDTPFFNATGEIGFAFVDQQYVYVASKAENDVAFSIIKNLEDEYKGSNGQSDQVGRYRQDLRELRMFYNVILGTEDICL